MPRTRQHDIISAEYARTIFTYEPETGLLRWRYNPARPKEWNTRHAGMVAGSLGPHGRIDVRFEHVLYLGHRLAWLLMTGEWPEEIDHKNGNPSDNRWTNLRLATRSQNTCNRKKPANNTSGFVGVRYRPHHKKWEARITLHRVLVWHSYHDSAQEAAAARRAALPEFHGEFIRHTSP